MNPDYQFFPWQSTLASSWLQERDRFAHAWLIHGIEGIGKTQFALAAAASLLCQSPVQGLACHRCQACQWVAGGHHPDIRRIRPDSIAASEVVNVDVPNAKGATRTPSREIRIDQLRELTPWFNTATHRGGWRVAVLYPAQSLNIVSANALLKVLEEPPANTVFLLVAEATDRLLPTLVSRCRRLPLPVPPASTSVEWLTQQGVQNPDDWLAAASHAPVRARNMASAADTPYPDWLQHVLGLATERQDNPDVGRLADQLEKEQPQLWIDTLQRLFLDLMLLRTGLPARYFPSLAAAAEIARHASAERLSEHYQWLTRQRAVARHPLNVKLFLHTALQQTVQACQRVSV